MDLSSFNIAAIKNSLMKSHGPQNVAMHIKTVIIAYCWICHLVWLILLICQQRFLFNVLEQFFFTFFIKTRFYVFFYSWGQRFYIYAWNNLRWLSLNQ